MENQHRELQLNRAVRLHPEFQFGRGFERLMSTELVPCSFSMGKHCTQLDLGHLAMVPGDKPAYHAIWLTYRPSGAV